MEVQIKHQPAYSLAVVSLAPNEAMRAEPGAMVSYSAGVVTDTKAEGGLFGGLKRMIGGESFFVNTWQAPAQGGEVTLAPALPGDMRVLELGGQDFLLQSGAFVASEDGIMTDATWGGARGFFGSGSLVLLRVSGAGKLVIGCYGAMEPRVLQAGEVYSVDTGHIVGFDASIQFAVRKVGSWKSTLLGGEGLVCELTGPGRLLMQTRSEEALVSYLGPRMPKETN
ncbi:MAG: TIGR00266 family protein [Anaerolineae bacterium]|nr:TIGR00266 family protein [Anaerolineae bacterium]